MDYIAAVREKMEKMTELASFSVASGKKVLFSQDKNQMVITIEVPPIFEEQFVYTKNGIESP